MAQAYPVLCGRPRLGRIADVTNIIDYARTQMNPFPSPDGAQTRDRATAEASLHEARPLPESRPLSDVDSLVLSQLAYVHMPDFVPRLDPDGEGADPESAYIPISALLKSEYFDEMFPSKGAYSSLCALVTAMAASPRFRDVRIGNYVSVEDASRGHEKQFAAVCALLPDGTEYVAFRGSEDSVAAWVENFNMAFTCPIPSQTAAARYVRRVAAATGRDLVLGGHSKGGNLAVYAAMKAPDALRARIRAVYSHDGPGFEKGVLDSLDFAAIAPVVHKTVPEASIIGMIFETHEDFTVVESEGHGITEHFAMRWKVVDGDFVRVPKLPEGTRYFSRTMNAWIASYTPRERERVLTDLFDILRATGFESFSDMAVHWRDALPAIRDAVKGMDPEERRFVIATFKVLFSTALRTVTTGRLPAPGKGDEEVRREESYRRHRDEMRTEAAQLGDEKTRIKRDLKTLREQYRSVRRQNKAEAKEDKARYKQAKKDAKHLEN